MSGSLDTHPTSGRGGPNRDGNDFERLRHARERHVGFPVGRYLQPPPMLFTRDGHNVFLGDMYRGHSAFLLCGGPSLSSHDLSKLNQRGILTCAINNAATVVRPHLWVSVDDPGNFSDAIWYDPGILKFVPLCHMEKRFTIRDEHDALIPSQQLAGDMPGVFGYRRNEAFNPEQWLHEDTFNWGNHSERVDSSGNKGSRSVMYVALRLLFYLGVRRLFLLGCDFRMTYGQANYAFDQDRTRSSVRGNNDSYRILNARLSQLKPSFEREGYEIFNCTPDSGLTVFPYLSFEDAIPEARATMPERILTAGMYDRLQREKDARNGKPSTITPRGDVVGLSGSSVDKNANRLPKFTLVTVIGQQQLAELQANWRGWMHRRQLREAPLLVVHDVTIDPASPVLRKLSKDREIQLVRWNLDNAASRRASLTEALIRMPAEYVRTPWYLQLDPTAIACDSESWVSAKWFDANGDGQQPVAVSHAWGYAKPADIISRLDDWGDTTSWLGSFPRVAARFEATADRIRLATISSWCYFGRTDFTREVADCTALGLPCDAHDTLLFYCAARRGERIVRVNMKKCGWSHDFKRSTKSTIQ